MSSAGALDLWETGLSMTPAARAVMLLGATGLDDIDSLPVGTRDVALLQAYCHGRGAMAAVADCPQCGTTVDLDLDVDAFAALDEPVPSVVVEQQEHRVVARIPTAADLAGLDPAARPSELARRLIARCVIEATCAGRPVDPADLPEDVTAVIEAALEQADPASDIRLTLSCPECSASWLEEVDPVRFAWSAVEADARRLATDVHTLAHAYGWSEEEILRLSPFRRHLYLSAVRP